MGLPEAYPGVCRRSYLAAPRTRIESSCFGHVTDYCDFGRVGLFSGVILFSAISSFSHTCRCSPHTLAAFAGWDARLDDVVRRLRCSKCHEKRCTARAVPMTTPRLGRLRKLVLSCLAKIVRGADGAVVQELLPASPSGCAAVDPFRR
jgi:hypothetical protein